MPSPVTLKIKFKSNSLQEFIERYSVDVSKGGIFIRTPKPLAVGTSLKFEFQFQDGNPLLLGTGTVVWTREKDPNKADIAPGMGLRFDRLPQDSQRILEQVLEQKQHALEFSSQPTRVATDEMAASLKDTDEEPADLKLPPSEEPQDSEETSPPDMASLDDEEEKYDPNAPTQAVTTTDEKLKEIFKPLDHADPLQKAIAQDEEIEEKSEVEEIEEKPEVEEIEEKLSGNMQAFSALQSEISEEKEEQSEDERKKRLEKILFPAEETSHPGSKVETSSQLDKSAPKLLPQTEGITQSTEEKSSLVMWLVILLIIAAGVFLYFKYVRKQATVSVDRTSEVNKTQLKTQPTPQPPPPQPERLTIKINSTPPGAKILIDGKETNLVTPTQLKDLDPEKEIEITADLLGKKLKTLKAKPNANQPIEFTLNEPSERVVHIISEPPEAVVFIGRKNLGPTPYLFKWPDTPKPQYLFFLYRKGYKKAQYELKTEGELAWTREGMDEGMTINIKMEEEQGRPAPPRRIVKDPAKIKVKELKPNQPTVQPNSPFKVPPDIKDEPPPSVKSKSHVQPETPALPNKNHPKSTEPPPPPPEPKAPQEEPETKGKPTIKTPSWSN